MSELYQLPDGWEWKELQSFGKFLRGVTYKKEQLLDTKTEDCLILLRANNIQNELNLDEVQFIPKDVGKGKVIEDGDILFAMSSGSKHLVGKNILLYGLNNHTFGAFCSVYRNVKKDLLNNYFLSYILKSNIYREKLSDLSMGANINNLKSSDLDIIKIPLPPIEEQQRIVSKLDLLFEKIDKSIALHQKNMDEADVFMGSVLNDVFDSEKIKEWKSFQFDKISKFIDYRGKTPKKIDSGIELITAKNVRFGYLSDQPKEYMSEDTYDEWMVRGIPQKGDVLFTTEAPLGNVAILNTNEKRIFAQRLITFKPLNDDIYQSKFLFYYMLSPYFRDELFEKSTGTTVKGIKSSILKKFQIKIPSVSIQQKVVKYLDEVSEKIEKVKSVQKEKMDSLKALKASILDRAFRGEL